MPSPRSPTTSCSTSRARRTALARSTSAGCWGNASRGRRWGRATLRRPHLLCSSRRSSRRRRNTPDPPPARASRLHRRRHRSPAARTWCRSARCGLPTMSAGRPPTTCSPSARPRVASAARAGRRSRRHARRRRRRRRPRRSRRASSRRRTRRRDAPTPTAPRRATERRARSGARGAARAPSGRATPSACARCDSSAAPTPDERASEPPLRLATRAGPASRQPTRDTKHVGLQCERGIRKDAPCAAACAAHGRCVHGFCECAPAPSWPIIAASVAPCQA